MPNEMNETELRRYAVLGARARLVAIAEETAAIHRAFPELRDGAASNGRSADGEEAAPAADGARSRRSMSAAERKAVSERMRKYWAERRRATKQGAAQEGTVQATRAAATASVVPRAKKRGRRTMSAAARKRISDAQRARWARQRQSG